MKNVLRTVHNNSELNHCGSVDVTERATCTHIAAITVWKIQKEKPTYISACRVMK